MIIICKQYLPILHKSNKMVVVKNKEGRVAFDNVYDNNL